MKTNPWLDHVKRTKIKNPDLTLKEVLQLASSTYTKKKNK